MQCVANERTTTHVNHSPVDDESTDAADETDLYPCSPAHQTDVSIATDVQLFTGSDLTQPPLTQAQSR